MMDDAIALIAAKHLAGVKLTTHEAEVLLDHYRATIDRIRCVLDEMGRQL